MTELETQAQEKPEQLAVDKAIDDLEALIANHHRSARWIGFCSVSAFVVLVLTGIMMNSQDTRAAIEVTSRFASAIETFDVKRVAIAQSTNQSDAFGHGLQAGLRIEDLLKPQIEAIVNHAKTAGTQYYNTLLLAGAGAFALVFGILMAIYRHHLTEVSKYQHYKTGFTRVRVAMRSAESGERTALVQAALLDRAFECRSGKEKQIESPVPGHPASDASTLLLNKLLELIEPSKRTKADT